MLEGLDAANARGASRWVVVGAAGLEPATPGLEGRCSIQMSYAPAKPIIARRPTVCHGFLAGFAEWFAFRLFGTTGTHVYWGSVGI